MDSSNAEVVTDSATVDDYDSAASNTLDANPRRHGPAGNVLATITSAVGVGVGVGVAVLAAVAVIIAVTAIAAGDAVFGPKLASRMARFFTAGREGDAYLFPAL